MNSWDAETVGMNNRERSLMSILLIVAEILELTAFVVSEILSAATKSITAG